MKSHWGQRLGNTIAMVTLLTAAVAIWLLLSREEPVPRTTPPTPVTRPR